MRTIVTEKDIQQCAAAGILYAGAGAILTDLAREAARVAGIKIVYTTPPAGADPPAGGEGGKLCVNLPDRDDATFVVQVTGGKVSIYEQTGQTLTLRETNDKRLCLHR